MPDWNNQYDSAWPAMPEVTSHSQDLLAVVYGHSQEAMFNALAFQVVRSNRRWEYIEDPFNGTIADDGTKDFGYFGENGFSRDTNSPGDELLAIQEERDSTVAEYGIAVPQDGVYVGLQTGGGDTVNGLREGSQRDRGISADDLDSYGGVLSDLTHIDAPAPTQEREVPTTAIAETPEHGLVRIDSDENGPNRFYFAFKNVSGGSVTIDVVAYAQTYEVQPILDTDTVRDIVAGDGHDRRIINYGAFGNTNPNLPTAWYDGEAEIDAADLAP